MQNYLQLDRYVFRIDEESVFNHFQPDTNYTHQCHDYKGMVADGMLF